MFFFLFLLHLCHFKVTLVLFVNLKTQRRKQKRRINAGLKGDECSQTSADRTCTLSVGSGVSQAFQVLNSHLLPQAVWQSLGVQHVEESGRAVRRLRLPPAVPVVALVRVGFVLGPDPRFPEPQQLQGSQDLLSQRRAVVRGSVAGGLPCVLTRLLPGGESETLQPDAAPAEDRRARRGRSGALQEGGLPGTIADGVQGLNGQGPGAGGRGQGFAGRAGGPGTEGDLQEAVLGAH